MRKFPIELKEWMEENASRYTAAEAAAAAGEQFGISITTEQLRGFLRRNHIRIGRKHRKITWTEEEEQYLREIFHGRPRAESYELFRKRFTGKTLSAYIGKAKVMGLSCGVDGKFHDGDGKPRNCFRKGNHYSQENEFKQGHIPHNVLPAGSIVKKGDGYLWIKDGSDGPCHKGWKQLHRYVWEQANGQIPEGSMLLFLDGNREHCELENLRLISRHENVVMNRKNLRSNDAQLSEIGITVAKIVIAGKR